MTDAAPATPRFTAKKEALLAAAALELNALGVKGMTLAGVAGRVGLSTTSVTYYFKRKEDLAAAALLRGVEILDGMVLAAAGETDVRARLLRFLDLYLDRSRRVRLGTDAPLAYFSEIPALKEPHRTAASDAYGQMFRHVRALFDDPAFAALDRLERNARAHLLMEQLFWTAGWLARYDVEDYARVRDRMFDILANGLAGSGRDWAPAPLAAPEPEDPSREEFLKAATRLMNQRGYRGASVEDISAALNLTKGSFYHHLDAKEDMVAACVRRTLGVLKSVQLAARATDGDAWAQVSASTAALVRLQLADHGPLLRSSVLSALPDAVGRRYADQYARITLRSASLLADGVAEGSVRAVDPMIAAQMLAAAVSGGATLSRWAPGVTPERAAAVFVRPLLIGVLSA